MNHTQKKDKKSKKEPAERAAWDQRAAWSIEQMVKLGVPMTTAEQLAKQYVSWHEVKDLIDRGCDPERAARIVG